MYIVLNFISTCFLRNQRQLKKVCGKKLKLLRYLIVYVMVKGKFIKLKFILFKWIYLLDINKFLDRTPSLNLLYVLCCLHFCLSVIFLAHLSCKLKWAFLITCCPLSFCLSFHLSVAFHIFIYFSGIEINFFTHKQNFACDYFFHKQKCNIQNFQKQFF